MLGSELDLKNARLQIRHFVSACDKNIILYCTLSKITRGKSGLTVFTPINNYSFSLKFM